MTSELFLTLFLAGVVGGALGAMMAKAAPWKGAAVAAIGLAIPIAISLILQIENGLVMTVAGMIAFGVIGGAFRFSGRQIVVVFLGSFLATAAAVAVLGPGGAV